ncbi:MAG TPA: undecaprenyl-diphosphate phosphatase [Trebonia sp.]|nr:undecaprenyl-diphosphate phosphatase [Trebonia sp.]
MTSAILLQPGVQAAAATAAHSCPAHITYGEAGTVGLIQGLSELFPISSLGHNVLIPALVGGCWAQNLNVASSESPYLAFIVGLHVATAAAMIIYFRRDWARIIRGFFTSLEHLLRPAPGTSRWEMRNADEKLAWIIIIATIPVGITGALGEHTFRVVFGHAIWAAVFLMANGLILLAAEHYYRTRPPASGSAAGAPDKVIVPELVAVGGGQEAARPATGHQAVRNQEIAQAIATDQRLADEGYWRGTVIGSFQILALLAGISRDGMVMAGGMFRGLTRQDAARFSFLLSAPVIAAAGVYKLPDLLGPKGAGIGGQTLFASVLAGVAGYLALRFLVRYLRTRTLTVFAIYSLLLGLGSVIYLELIK